MAATISESKFDGSSDPLLNYGPNDNGLMKGASAENPVVMAKRPKAQTVDLQQPISPSSYMKTAAVPDKVEPIVVAAPEPSPINKTVSEVKPTDLKLPLFDIFKVETLIDRVRSVNYSIFEDDDVHPLALLIAMGHMLGGDWLVFEPETLWSEIGKYTSAEIPRLIKDKILAVRAAHRINDFYSNFQAFEKIGSALNDMIPDFHTLQLLNMPQVVNTLNILDVIRDDDVYNSEIAAYISAIARNEGIIVYHPILSKKIPAFKSEEMLMDDVQQRMQEIQANPSVMNLTSIVDVQAAKLLVVDEYIAAENKQFSDNVYYYFNIE